MILVSLTLIIGSLTLKHTHYLFGISIIWDNFGQFGMVRVRLEYGECSDYANVTSQTTKAQLCL